MNILRFVIPKSLVEYITVDSTVRQALEKMRFHRYTAIPVLDKEGRYVGTIRNDDIYKYFFDNGAFDFRSAERDGIIGIINPSYSKPLFHHASMSELIDMAKEHNFVPVVDDRSCFIGIILRRDILNFLYKYYEENENSNKEKNKSEEK